MVIPKRFRFILFLILSVFTACVSAPDFEKITGKEPFAQRHYTFTVLLIPEYFNKSPRLELAMSLLEMDRLGGKAEFLYEILYKTESLDAYKDKVIREQRDIARMNITKQDLEEEKLPGYHLRHVERFNANNIQQSGIIVERTFETYLGDAHGRETKRYYVIDLEEPKLIKVDDLFSDFQGVAVREVVYAELRKYGGLEEGRPLSEGIFFKDEPELSFNFFLTPQGLGLHWDPHQIAPFSEGLIEVIVPWRSIRPLMLRSGIELLTKFGINLLV